jgi:hypothetical protein
MSKATRKNELYSQKNNLNSGNANEQLASLYEASPQEIPPPQRQLNIRSTDKRESEVKCVLARRALYLWPSDQQQVERMSDPLVQLL